MKLFIDTNVVMEYVAHRKEIEVLTPTQFMEKYIQYN